MLEYCVLRLQYAVEVALARHGKNIAEEQITLGKIANIAIDTYAMTAVLSRASRSYCIGLRNAAEEILLASTFCFDAHRRVKDNANSIVDGPAYNNDENYKKVAAKVFESHGYFAEHPLTR
ncbi:hypothetical protein J437_LFUL010480, partial [Ladona fulva]